MTLSAISKRMVMEEGLAAYTEDFSVSTTDVPHQIRIGRKTIYFLLHEVGDTNRYRQDECRIQTSVRNRNALASKAPRIAVLGFLSAQNVLTAWDPQRFAVRAGGGTVFSLYSRYSIQRRAGEEGLAVYVDDDSQHVISMKPELIGPYFQNTALFHDTDEAQLKRAIAGIPDEPNKPKRVAVRGTRKKFSFLRTQYPRDPRFVAAVKDAYNHACAMCGVQLDLVEAAHIIPHRAHESTDEVTNGIALCPLHHRAFDRGLVGISGRLRVLVDASRANSLRDRGRHQGLSTLQRLRNKLLALPSERKLWPSKKAIQKRSQHAK